MQFPKSISEPDSDQRLFEKLSQDPDDHALLDYIRRHMRYIYTEEQKAPRSKTDSNSPDHSIGE